MRKRLPRQAAHQQYIQAGEMEVLRQLQRDARALDAEMPEKAALALGPFARVSAEAVLGDLGKTRGAINHLWGSQEAFRAAVMNGFLNDDTLGMESVTVPEPQDSGSVEEWIGRVAAMELARGPQHGGTPVQSYGFRWAAWLGLAPYGLWSKAVAESSLQEYRHRVGMVDEEILQPGLRHFRLRLASGVSAADLAIAFVSTVEGFWLNACLTSEDPLARKQPLVKSLTTALLILVRGATSR
jgi:hypothetical protein